MDLSTTFPLLSIFSFRHNGSLARRRAGQLLGIDCVQPLVFPGAFMPFQPSDFDNVRQTYLRRLFSSSHPIALGETRLRATFAIFWAWSAYAAVDGAHAALSVLLVVVLRLDQPHEWPPIYGHLRDASSLHGFWGKFWHRLVALPYGNYGKWIAEKVFGLQPRSSLHKLVVAFAIFLISGLTHSAVAWQLGGCGWYSDVWWFCMNFMANALEGAVWTKILHCTAMPHDGSVPRLRYFVQKCLGFMWVFAFFFWSVPKWQCPKVHCLFADVASSQSAIQL